MLIDLEEDRDFDTLDETPLQVAFGKPMKISSLYDVLDLHDLKESFSKLGDKVFITDYANDVIKFINNNKSFSYRLLYDKNLDLYCIWAADSYIHQDVIELLLKNGYYSNKKVVDTMKKLGNADFKPSDMKYLIYEYVEKGLDGDEELGVEPYLLYAIYAPKNSGFSLGDDGYSK